MKKGKVFVLSLVMASLIGILLSSGVVSAHRGDCEVPDLFDSNKTYCFIAGSASACGNVSGAEYGAEICEFDGVPETKNCCMGQSAIGDGEPCLCFTIGHDNPDACEACGGYWVDNNGCGKGVKLGEPCTIGGLTTEGCNCVPEASTIALLATGLIGLVGYFRLRRKEE